MILKEIGKYYETDPAVGSCPSEAIYSSIVRGLSNAAHAAIFKEIFDNLPAVSVPNIERELLDVAREARAMALANALLNKDDLAQRTLLPEYQDLLDRTALTDKSDNLYKVFSGVATEQLMEQSRGKHKIPLAPTSLNSIIGGGCVAGDSVLVLARPEIGKTAFAINLARGATRGAHTVLYCSNEDSITRLILRAKACYADRTVTEVLGAPADADSLAKEAGFERCTFVEMYPGNLRQIRQLVEEYTPDMLIVDQLINLEGPKDENHTLQLGKLARGIRNLGKQYGLVTVVFVQAGESATNKLVLEISDVNWSNTDIQAAADLMIGIGANDDFLRNDWRMLSLCKNKLSGTHEYFRVRLDRFKSRFYSAE